MSHRIPHALLLLVSVMAACSNDGKTPLDPNGGSVASITIAPGDLSFASLGTTANLTAAPRDADGAAVSATITWAKRGSGVVTVSSSGVVTAVGNGSDSVIVTAGSARAAVAVQVQQVASAITVSAPTTTFTRALQGATVSAQVVDANNHAVAGTEVSYSSSDPSIIFVSTTGVVTAAKAGTSTITATAGAHTGTLTLTADFQGPLGPGLTGQARPCSGGTVGPFPCNAVTLLSYLPIAALGGAAGVDLNDVWGWTDQSTGREYALVGRSDGIVFVDVTNATDPRFLGFLPITSGASPNVWHDVKVYADHAYVVADGAGPHGMQVFDLHELRSVPVPRQFSSVMVYTGVRSAHNMVINETTGFGYIVGASGGGNTCGGGLHMVNLQVPTAPTFAGCFNDDQTGRAGTGYTHDAQCVTYTGPDATYQGHEICFGLNETALSIADVTSKSVPTALSRASYPAVSYAHQGWLTADQRYLYTNDELDEINGLAANTRTMIWDVADLEDPVLVGQFLGPTGASDHNNYIRGTTMFASNYQFGVRVISVANPLSPVQVGYIDTSPLRPDLPGFDGSWSNYPFFPSGNVVITSGEEGLFVIRVP